MFKFQDEEDVESAAKHAGVDVKELTLFKRGVKAVGNLVLSSEEDKKLYYEHYSCKPPPVFMITISLIEVRFIHTRPD